MMKELIEEIAADPQNKEYTEKGIKPIFVVDEETKILIIGQAPGLKVQESGIMFNDKSGEKLMDWLGVEEEEFRNPKDIGVMPMDFYYPGRGKSGDKAPRKGFADKWHPIILSKMKNVQLTILMGNYAMKYYLKGRMERNLTETVRSYENYLPKYFPVVHPSPLNFRWFNKNPWFEKDVVPVLRRKVDKIIR